MFKNMILIVKLSTTTNYSWIIYLRSFTKCSGRTSVATGCKACVTGALHGNSREKTKRSNSGSNVNMQG